MNIELHKKTLKVWFIIIAMSTVTTIGIALIEGIFGSLGDLHAAAFKYGIPECMRDNAAAILDKLDSNSASADIEKLVKMKSRVLFGGVISVLFALICEYLLAFILVKYLSTTVLLISDREIRIKG